MSNPDLIHPTAIIDASAVIAADAQIGPYCIIGPQVTIGAGTKLHSHVVVEDTPVLASIMKFFSSQAWAKFVKI